MHESFRTAFIKFKEQFSINSCNQVSISRLLYYACDWLKDLSSTFKPIRCNARTIACVQTPQATEQNMLIFPVFFASQAYMLPDVIGSYDCTEY